MYDLPEWLVNLCFITGFVIFTSLISTLIVIVIIKIIKSWKD